MRIEISYECDETEQEARFVYTEDEGNCTGEWFFNPDIDFDDSPEDPRGLLLELFRLTLARCSPAGGECDDDS